MIEKLLFFVEMSVFYNLCIVNKKYIFCELTKMLHFIITGQSGQWASRIFSVILHIYLLQFKNRANRFLLFTTATFRIT